MSTHATALDTATEHLAGRLRGPLLRPGDEGYDNARALFNGMIDRRPALIARCTGAADVISCVNVARETRLPIAVKAGGHGVAGKALCDDGLVIDLSAMNAVNVDPEAGIARVQAGAQLGDLDHEAQAFGLATPAGIHSRTGVAGLALGGGTGHLSRAFGITADNLIAADIVTADGRLLRASEQSHPDLFWALRGGGGNFGVVTQFEFRLHPVGPEVASAQVYHPFDDAERVLRRYRDFVRTAPNEIGCACLILRVPPVDPFPEARHGQLTVLLLATYAGDAQAGHRALQPLLEGGDPIFSDLSTIPFTALQSAFDDGFPDGARYYWKAHFLRDLPDEAIAAFIANVAPMPGDYSACGFEAMGGAVNQVVSDATAFPHRNAAFSIGIFGGWARPDEDAAGIAWARELHAALAPYSTGGVYVNYLQGDDDAAADAYGSNFDRLRRIKQSYDPDGLFDAHERIEQ